MNDDLLNNYQKYPPTSFSYLNFFSEMIGHIFDTYLIVSLALYAVCSTNHVVKEARLIEELHKVAKDMYEE